ncbi:streptolysin O [Streptococcus pyogenes]|nr:streptolysin O [Streptococcus pyogenes]
MSNKKTFKKYSRVAGLLTAALIIGNLVTANAESNKQNTASTETTTTNEQPKSESSELTTEKAGQKTDDMLNSNDMIKLAPKEMPLESAEKEEKKSEDKKKSEEDHTEEINDKIYSLNYNELEVLAKNGETIENFVPKEGVKKADNLLSLKERKKISTLHQSIFPLLTLSLIGPIQQPFSWLIKVLPKTNQTR